MRVRLHHAASLLLLLLSPDHLLPLLLAGIVPSAGRTTAATAQAAHLRLLLLLLRLLRLLPMHPRAPAVRIGIAVPPRTWGSPRPPRTGIAPVASLCPVP